MVLFYKSRTTFIFNRTATSRQVCCSAGDRDLHWRSRCCATFATAAHVAWDEFWRRRRERKHDSAERAAIFFFFFFLRIQANQCARPTRNKEATRFTLSLASRNGNNFFQCHFSHRHGCQLLPSHPTTSTSNNFQYFFQNHNIIFINFINTCQETKRDCII